VRSALRIGPARAGVILTFVGGITLAVVLHGGSGRAENKPESRAAFTIAGGEGAPRDDKPKLRGGRDLLSADEIGYAIHLATTASALPGDATDVRNRPGLEVLFVDLPPADNRVTSRRALVVAYDYTSNATIQTLVDLESGVVENQRRAPGVQPPPSADEAEAAVTAAIESGMPLRFIADFEASEGVPLVDREQVGYTAGSFVHDGTPEGGKECGRDRCVQLLVRTPAGTYLDTTDFVVDLSNRTIIQVDE